MSEEAAPPPNQNRRLILISGKSATGKSAALRNIRNQASWWYFNCESGKDLPFKNQFRQFVITDPYQVNEGFNVAIEKPEVGGIVIDSQTFLMDMFESQYVIGSANTMQGWSNYAQFFKNLMQKKVPEFNRPVIIIAHALSTLNETEMTMETAVPIKGALKNNGIEAYFSTVVMTEKMPLKELEPYKSDLLNITEDDEIVGYKHVFQTRPTKTTVGKRIRSPMGLFSREQSFIDNDAQLLLDHLSEYYGIQ